MKSDELLGLVRKFNAGNASPEEVAALERYYALFADESGLSSVELEKLDERLKKGIQAKISKLERKPRRLYYRIVAAASVVIILYVGGYKYFQQKRQAAQAIRFAAIMPGGNKAILTLSGGQQISLTDAKNGHVAQQGGVQVNKTQNGQLAYTGMSNEVAYNTVSTPRGGQYKLTLSDGTKIMLDAASSVSYPTAFTGKDRLVKVTGQVYFEVVHNAARPFKVEAGNISIEDIGTHFNVDANDQLKVTLVEGAVSVAGHVLKPGEQAIEENNNISVKQADVEAAVAWTNGYFMFDGENIQSVMRMIARWYDVQVVYDGELPADKFGGTISRFTNVSQVLKKLELTGRVHFKIEGRRVMVTK